MQALPVVVALTFGVVGVSLSAHAEPQKRATADIINCTDQRPLGKLQLTERPSAQGVKLVDVAVQVDGLPDGVHAVHIHETGDCAPCGDAGGHFDPGPSGNPSPDGNHPDRKSVV